MATKLTDKYLKGFVNEHEYEGVAAEVKAAHKVLHDGTGLGNDFLGWLNLPTDYDKEEFARIKAAAEKIKKRFRCIYRNRYWRFIPRCKSRN